MWPSRKQKTMDGAASAPRDVSDLVAVLGASSAGGALLDEQGRFLYVNDLARRMGLIDGDRFALHALDQLCGAVRQAGEIQRITIEIPRTAMEASGGFANLVLEVRAIALRHGTVMLLAEDRTAARQLDSVRRDFVANISHELKTPVGAIALLAETIADASDDPPAVAEFASRIRKEAARLTSLVQEVIELSRAEAAAALNHPRLVSVDALIVDAVDQSATTAAAREITLALAPETGAKVRGDHDVLVTAVRNLVDNAVNYSPDGSHVAVGARVENGSVEIAVIDHGPGIDPALQPRIFERFFRIDPARSRETGGSGLGLSIVKHVAAEHGGDVQVWSKPGHGSTFTLRLPQTGGEDEK